MAAIAAGASCKYPLAGAGAYVGASLLLATARVQVALPAQLKQHAFNEAATQWSSSVQPSAEGSSGAAPSAATCFRALWLDASALLGDGKGISGS